MNFKLGQLVLLTQEQRRREKCYLGRLNSKAGEMIIRNLKVNLIVQTINRSLQGSMALLRDTLVHGRVCVLLFSTTFLI